MIFTGVRAGGTAVAGSGDNPRVTLRPNDSLEVSFASISFQNAQRTRYRYMIEGLDAGWHYTSRSAGMLNFPYLPGGDYQLVVQSALKRGDWPTTGTRLGITVVPSWWEWWVTYVAVAATLVAATVAYALYRTERLRASFNLRLEERLSERTRVARELHDTLLQSFQGLTFRVQAASNAISTKPDRATEILDGVLEQSDSALIEGRNAIRALRDPGALRLDLGAAIRIKGNELSAVNSEHERPSFSMVELGDPTPLDPDTRDEIYRICSEALQNAFSHAEASKIECVLEYSLDGLKLAVKDNGTGMAASSRSTKSWGVRGMRERADQIGATLSVQSLEGVGTLIELQLPARQRRKTLLRWMTRK